MYSSSREGLGFAFVIPLIMAVGSAAAGAAASRLLAPKPPGPPTRAELEAAELERMKDFKAKAIPIAAGGLLLVFIIMATRK